MKGTYHIPDSDFEAYFIPPPEGRLLSGKKAAQWITGELEKIHPGFGASHEIYTRTISILGSKWYLVTVMTTEALIEHRALAGSSRLIAIEGYTVNNEGFPVASRSGLAGSTGPESPEFRTVGKHRYVFPRVDARLLTRAAIVAASLIALTLFGRLSLFRGAEERKPLNTAPPEVYSDPLPILPDALILFAAAASGIATSGATLNALDITLHGQSLALLNLSGREPLSVMGPLSNGGFFQDGDFGTVSFIKESPSFSLKYAFPSAYTLPFSDEVKLNVAASAFTPLQKAIIGAGGSLDTLRIAVGPRGNELALRFSTALSASSKLFYSLRDVLDELGFIVMELQADKASSGDILHVEMSCGMAKTVISENHEVIGFESIPRAFGYLAAPRPVPIKNVSPSRETLPQDGWERVGSVINESGVSIVYWRDKEGKIHEISN